ncbi:hypothetical protein Trydic_g8094 [Trypoxylus dichotomus]
MKFLGIFNGPLWQYKPRYLTKDRVLCIYLATVATFILGPLKTSKQKENAIFVSETLALIIEISSDSQTAIKALVCDHISSKIVWGYLKDLVGIDMGAACRYTAKEIADQLSIKAVEPGIIEELIAQRQLPCGV